MSEPRLYILTSTVGFTPATDVDTNNWSPAGTQLAAVMTKSVTTEQGLFGPETLGRGGKLWSLAKVWCNGAVAGTDKVEVRSDEVPDPVAVRYGWADNPVVNLYSREGLPVNPFRTDDWPGVTAEAR